MHSKACLLMLLGLASLEAQPETPYYYAGKRRIDLQPVSLALVASSTKMPTFAISIYNRDPEGRVRTPRLYRYRNLHLQETRRFEVEFRPETSDNQVQAALKLAAGSPQRSARNRNRYSVVVPQGASSLTESRKLSLQDSVVYSEPDFRVLSARSAMLRPDASVAPPRPGSVRPTDPFVAHQHNLARVGLLIPSPAGAVGLTEWLDLSSRKLTVKIAVLDDGLDMEHPDIKPRMGPIEYLDVVGPDPDTGLPPCGRERFNPWDRHGTACAGIIAAAMDNSLGIAGLVSGGQILAIRTNCRRTAGAIPYSLIGDFEVGFQEAIARGVDVISLSAGASAAVATEISERLRQAVEEAVTKGRGGLGIVVVAAAGNDGGEVDHPARLASDQLPIIAVAASGQDDRFKTMDLSTSGDWGTNCGTQITVAAPGVEVPTAIQFDQKGQPSTHKVWLFSGTSAATPMVAALAALVIARNPKLTAAQVREHVRDSGDFISGACGPLPQFQARRINFCRALGGMACRTFNVVPP